MRTSLKSDEQTPHVENSEQEELEAGEDPSSNPADPVPLTGVSGPLSCPEQNGTPEFIVGKPQVWVRIRPTPCCNSNIFDISEDSKSLNITVESKDRIMQKKSGKPTIFKFGTDGILKDAPQPEAYESFILDLVQKAMDGVCGAVVCVGPEASGKSYSLFGSQGLYKDRGMIFRSLETIFEMAETAKEEKLYHVVLSMFEIRKDRIKDLLTLGDYELRQVGEFGPKGLFYEEIFCVEQALTLILRGLEGQKLFPRESWAKPHTIAYIDIICQPMPSESGEVLGKWRSRITFAKIASMPQSRAKTNLLNNAIIDQPFGHVSSDSSSSWPPPCPGYDPNFYTKSQGGETIQQQQQRYWANLRRAEMESQLASAQSNCCKGPPGDLAESISIRKDFSFLEQMFIRANELRRIANYYAKLQSLGMYMLVKPPKLAPSQYFRQSRLAHCLKDIVTGKTEVRVLLHIRPEKDFIQSTLEAMRFAERARCIPCQQPKKQDPMKGKTFEQRIAHMCHQLGIEDPIIPSGDGNNGVSLSQLYPHINADKMKEIMAQATHYFEEKLDLLEGNCKEQVKNMFETFREMWVRLLESSQQGPNTQDESEAEYEAEEEDNIFPDSAEGLPISASIMHTKKRSAGAASMMPGTKDSGSGGNTTKKKNPNKENARTKGRKKRRSSTNKLKNLKGGKPDGSKATDGAADDPKNLSNVDGAGKEIVGQQEEGGLPPGERDNEEGEDINESGQGETSGIKWDSTAPVASETKGPRGTLDVPVAATVAARKTKGKSIRSSFMPKMSTANVNGDVSAKRTSTNIALGNVDTSVDNPSSGDTQSSPKLDDSSNTNSAENPEEEDSAVFKHQTWDGFKQSEAGGKLLYEFGEKQAALRQSLLEHTEVQNEISGVILKMTKNQMELDFLEQERQLRGGGIGITYSGSPIRPGSPEETLLTENENLQKTRDDLLGRLQVLRTRLQENKQYVDELKKECERKFQEFCLVKFNRIPDMKFFPLSNLSQAVSTAVVEALGFSIPIEPPEPDNESEQLLRKALIEQRLAEKFEEIKLIAKLQAKELMSLYPKRPPWATSYAS